MPNGSLDAIFGGLSNPEKRWQVGVFAQLFTFLDQNQEGNGLCQLIVNHSNTSPYLQHHLHMNLSKCYFIPFEDEAPSLGQFPHGGHLGARAPDLKGDLCKPLLILESLNISL